MTSFIHKTVLTMPIILLLSLLLPGIVQILPENTPRIHPYILYGFKNYFIFNSKSHTWLYLDCTSEMAKIPWDIDIYPQFQPPPAAEVTIINSLYVTLQDVYVPIEKYLLFSVLIFINCHYNVCSILQLAFIKL